MTDNEKPMRIVMKEEPSYNFIFDFIGNAKTPWLEFTSFLDENYDFSVEKIYYGKKYGWSINYIKSCRTWCALYPQKDCFEVEILLNKREVEKFQERREEFGDLVLNKFDTAKKMHDGIWMFFTIADSSLIEELKKLMIIKRKPKKS